MLHLQERRKRATLTFTNNRYRWGKIIESEESRFLDELDSSFVKFDNGSYANEDMLTHKTETLDFNSIKNKFRKLENSKIIHYEMDNSQISKIKRFKINSIVKHPIFGKG